MSKHHHTLPVKVLKVKVKKKDSVDTLKDILSDDNLAKNYLQKAEETKAQKNATPNTLHDVNIDEMVKGFKSKDHRIVFFPESDGRCKVKIYSGNVNSTTDYESSLAEPNTNSTGPHMEFDYRTSSVKITKEVFGTQVKQLQLKPRVGKISDRKKGSPLTTLTRAAREFLNIFKRNKGRNSGNSAPQDPSQVAQEAAQAVSEGKTRDAIEWKPNPVYEGFNDFSKRVEKQGQGQNYPIYEEIGEVFGGSEAQGKGAQGRSFASET